MEKKLSFQIKIEGPEALKALEWLCTAPMGTFTIYVDQNLPLF